MSFFRKVLRSVASVATGGLIDLPRALPKPPAPPQQAATQAASQEAAAIGAEEARAPVRRRQQQREASLLGSVQSETSRSLLG